MFGKRLKEARLAKGLTLDELATKYNERFDGGLNKGTLSKYENDKQEPMINVVNNLSIFLDVSVDYLLCREELPKDEVAEYLDILHKRDDMRMLFSVAKTATREDVETAAKIIEALIKKERKQD